MQKTKVLIVDDHAILRMGLASLLNGTDAFEVVGDASNGKSGVRKAVSLRPDVIIMDLMMPDMDGDEATQKILDAQPSAKVLLLTTFGTSDGITRALNAGAIGAIMKGCDFTELATAIRAVAAGQRYLSEEVQRIIRDNPPVPTLSPRQREILEALADGRTNPDIAKALGISVSMVHEHMTSLFEKLGAANRAEAVAIAFRRHLLKK